MYIGSSVNKKTKPGRSAFKSQPCSGTTSKTSHLPASVSHSTGNSDHNGYFMRCYCSMLILYFNITLQNYYICIRVVRSIFLFCFLEALVRREHAKGTIRCKNYGLKGDFLKAYTPSFNFVEDTWDFISYYLEMSLFLAFWGKSGNLWFYFPILPCFRTPCHRTVCTPQSKAEDFVQHGLVAVLWQSPYF